MTYTFFDPDDDSSAPRDDDVSAISGNLNGGTTSLWAQDLQRLSPMSDSLDVLKDEHKVLMISPSSIDHRKLPQQLTLLSSSPHPGSPTFCPTTYTPSQ